MIIRKIFKKKAKTKEETSSSPVIVREKIDETKVDYFGQFEIDYCNQEKKSPLCKKPCFINEPSSSRGNPCDPCPPEQTPGVRKESAYFKYLTEQVRKSMTEEPFTELCCDRSKCKGKNSVPCDLPLNKSCDGLLKELFSYKERSSQPAGPVKTCIRERSSSCPTSPRKLCPKSWQETQSTASEPPKPLTSTLMDLINKITSKFVGESPPADDPSDQPRNSKMCCSKFTQRPVSADAAIGREVQEIFFNKGMAQSDNARMSDVCTGEDSDPLCVSTPPCLSTPPCKSKPPRQSKLPRPSPPTPPRCARCLATTKSPRQSSPQCGRPQLGSPPRTPPCQHQTPCRPKPPCQPSPPCKPKTSPRQQTKPCQEMASPCQSLCGVNDEDVCDMSEEMRLQYYRNKLAATQQCLLNKEETVRVQQASLDCAEQCISSLTKRTKQQRSEIERLHKELNSLMCKPNVCCNKSDACCGTDTCDNVDECCQPEMENQKNMVVTLQNNLWVIEDLYRECFYETAKQEELIEKLRKSYLDVRLMEKEKANKIGHLEKVIHKQKWSLETCHDVAMEVENLKSEISNFLNSSNNDSGVWEQSIAGEVGEELNDIMQQLHQLQEVVQEFPEMRTCELEKENQCLKDLNRNLQCKVDELSELRSQLEYANARKEDTIGRLKGDHDKLCCTVQNLRKELEAGKERECHLNCQNQELTKEVQQLKGALQEARNEFCCWKKRSSELEVEKEAIAEELAKADNIIKEHSKVRSEVSYLAQQVALWRQQLAESEERVQCVESELARARLHCRTVDQCYREKVAAVEALQEQLEEAHARGAQLCGESRRVVASVRSWIRRMQDTNEQQSQKIKAQEAFIKILQRTLQELSEKQTPTTHRSDCAPCNSQPPCPGNQTDCLPDQYYDSYRATDLTVQSPFEGIGCSKCAAKRPTDPSRSPTDDSDDVGVSCGKRRSSASIRANVAGSGVPTTIVGCSKCAPKRKSKLRTEKNEDECELSSANANRSSAGDRDSNRVQCACKREGSSTRLQCACKQDSTSVRAARGSKREDDAQMCEVFSTATETASCSQAPTPPRRLLRKKLYNDRVAQFLRCTAEPTCHAGVQSPARSEAATSPPPSLAGCRLPPGAHPHPPPPPHASRIPKAVSGAGELMERVERLQDAVEESQRRWSTKLPTPQRDRRP